MNNSKVFFAMIISLMISSCIELPPIDELPYLIIYDDGRSEGDYTFTNNVNNLSINVLASYFYSTDSLTTYSTIRLKIKNFGGSKILFDSSSVMLESNSFEYILLHNKPSKVFLEPNKESDLLYLFQSETSVGRNEEVVLLKLFVSGQKKELITKLLLRKT